MSDDLKIILTAGLNIGQSVGDINAAIRGLAKHPHLRKLNLKINIDESFVKSINSFISATDKLNVALKVQNKVVDETITEFRELDGSVKKVTQQILKNGEIINKTKTVHDANKKAIQSESSAYESQRKTIKQLERELSDYSLTKQKVTKNSSGQITGYNRTYKNDEGNLLTVRTDQNGFVKKYDEINDFLKRQKDTLTQEQAVNKQREQIAKDEYSIRKALEDKKLKEHNQHVKQIEAIDKAHYLALKTDKEKKEALEKTHILALQQNAKREQEYANSIANMQSKINNAQKGLKTDSASYNNLSRLSSSLTNVTNIGDFKSKLANINTEFKKITSSATQAEKVTMTFGQSLGTAMQKFPVWMAASTAFFLPLRAMQDAVRTIIEIDSQMTELVRVMDDFADFDGMLRSSIGLANELGRTIRDVNEAMIGFARQGYDEQETMALSKSAVLAQNISELTAKESVDTLTSGMINFNIAAEDSIRIVDSLNEVDNNFATTTRDLSLSINKAGSAAKTFGVTLDELLGHTTAIQMSTRETGNIVGNSLKTIYSRLTTMYNSEDLLAAAGVQMRDMNGEVRTSTELLEELAAKWNTLSAEQQQNTAVGLAGRFQLTRFLALMQNYSIALNATETSLNSQGSAMSENEKYMQSLEAKIQKMKTAWETLSLAFGNAVISDSIIGLTTLLASLANGFAIVVDKVGLLPILFGAAHVGFTLLSASFRAFVTNLATSIISLSGLATAATVSGTAFKGLAGSFRLANISLKGFLASTGVGLIFVALGSALEWVVKQFSDTATSADNVSDSMDNLNSKLADVERLNQLSTQYETLAKSTLKTAEEKMKLSQIESELFNNHGVIIQNTNEQTEAIDANIDAIKRRTNALKEEISIEQEKAVTEFRKSQTATNKNIEKNRKLAEELRKEYENAINNEDKFRQQRPDFEAQGMRPTWLNKLQEDYATAVSDAREKYISANDEFLKDVNTKELALKSLFKGYIDSLEVSGEQIDAKSKKMADAFASIMARTGEDDYLILEKFKSSFKEIMNEDVSNLEDASKLLQRLTGETNLATKEFSNLQSFLASMNFGNVSSETEEIEENIQSLSSTLSDVKGKVQPLNKVLKELEKGHKLTSDEILDLIANNEELASSMKIQDGQLTLSKKAIEKLRDAYIDSATTNEKTRKDELQSEQKVLRDKLQLYAKQVWGMQGVADVREALVNKMEALEAKANNSDNNVFVRFWANVQKTWIGKEISDFDKDNKKVQDQIDKLNATIQAVTNSMKDYGSETEKTNETIKKTNELLTEHQKKLKDVQKALTDLENKRARMKPGSKQYLKSLEDENKLLEQQKQLLKEGIADPSKLVSTKIETTSTVSDGSSFNSSSGLGNLISSALDLQGQFKYKQVSGEYQGTFDEFVKGATSDCSQFVQEMFKEFLNIKLPRTAAEQAKQGTEVKKISDLQPGDLVFFNTVKGKENSHTGIYTGNGKFIQMGNSGLKEQNIYNPYWFTKYNTARRVIPSSVSTQPTTSSKSYTGKYANAVNKYASDYGIDPNLIAAIIQQESTFNPNAGSSAGARGLMQLMPGTAKEMGVKDITNPADNIAGGTRYFAQMLQRYKGDVELALMAYNAGPSRIDKWIDSGRSTALPTETTDYVPKVMGHYQQFAGSTAVNGMVNGSQINIVPPTSEELAQAVEQAENELSEIDLQQYRNDITIVQQSIIPYENRINAIQSNISKSQVKQSRFGENTPEYRKEEMSQISYLDQEQKQVEKMNAELKKLVEEKKITSGEFDQQIEQNSLRWWELEVEKQEKRFGLLSNSLEKYNKKREEYSKQIEESEVRASQLDTAAPAYRKELEKQISLKKLILKQNDDEIKTIEEKLKNTKLLPKNIEELNTRLDNLKSQNITIGIDISDTHNEMIDSYLEGFSDKIKAKDDELQALQDNLLYLEKGTPEYTKELMKQIPLIQDKIKLNKDEIAYLESQIKRTDISVAKRKELNDLLVEANELQRQFLHDTRAIQEEIVDGIIEGYKKAIEQRRDLELASLDERMKLEDERHEKALKNLDEEYSKFEKYINAQLKALDRQNASDDYEKELNKKLKERQEIIDKINVLSLDNSMEAKAKRKTLQEQLDSKNEEIDEFTLQRERELRKQGLQDQLDDRKEYNDQVRKDEDELYDQNKKKNDQERKDIERKYKDLLEDEKKFYNLKQGLLSQDKMVVKSTIDEIKGFYTTLYSELEIALKSHVIASQKEYDNLKYMFDKQVGNLDGYYNGPSSGQGSGSGNSAKLQAWAEYLSNKQKAEKLTSEVIQLQREKNPDTKAIKQKQDEIAKLRSINDRHRAQHGFPDGRYDELKSIVMSAETGGMTPAWGKSGKFLLAHEKELILNKSDTSNLLKVIDFTRNIIDSLKSSFNPDAVRPSQSATSTDNSIRIDEVNIYAHDKDTGTSLLGKLEDALSTKIKLRTV
ncbi:phage tail tape measure protein [Paenibacillus lautus]|uniref:phage tail tape measure protein n=1 Tax=Paenibacillus lautus TaxID=1401 RepID=UPI00203BA1FF|nr:phage tail tape measure protein [Paenibacillus lautus]MCM3256984.1 phage tail tape measure protein [Paenibacillus lautus]